MLKIMAIKQKNLITEQLRLIDDFSSPKFKVRQNITGKVKGEKLVIGLAFRISP